MFLQYNKQLWWSVIYPKQAETVGVGFGGYRGTGGLLMYKPTVKRSCIHAELNGSNFTFKSKISSQYSKSHMWVIVYLRSQCLQLIWFITINENSSFRRVVAKQYNFHSEKKRQHPVKVNSYDHNTNIKTRLLCNHEKNNNFTAEHKTTLWSFKWCSSQWIHILQRMVNYKCEW